jgi:predicted PurR-regulated permease PerM
MIPRGPVYRAGPLVWSGVIGSTCLLLFVFQKTLWLVLPFLFALVIYYLLLPLVQHLVLAGVRHDKAATLVSVSGFLLTVLVFLVASPWLAAQAVGWQETVMAYLDGGQRFVLTTLRGLESRFPVLGQAHVSSEVARQISEVTDQFAARYLPAFAMALASWGPSVLLAPFISFFMLRDGPLVKRFIIEAVPNAYFEHSLYLLERVDLTARLYFQGLIKLTVLDTLCLAAGLWYLGVSGPLLLGLVTAVLAWIPYIGSILGCLVVVLVAATDFPATPQVAYGAIALFLIVRMLDDFFFMPLTIGRSLKMHPLLTVLMIFVGGAVAGIPGLMLVLPVLGVMMVLGENLGMILTDPRLRARHRHARRLREQAVNRDLN